MLMQVVCQGTQSPEIRIRTASFECLHEIAAMYYAKLPAYMTELYNITVRGHLNGVQTIHTYFPVLKVSKSHTMRTFI